MKEFTFSQYFSSKRLGYYALGILGSIVMNAVFLSVPAIIGGAIDSLTHHRTDFIEYIWKLLAIIGVTMILKYFYRRLLLGSVRHLEYTLRGHLFDKSLRLPISYYEKNGPGKVMALMTNDVTSIRVALGLGIMILVDALFFCVFAMLIMIRESSFMSTAMVLSPMLIITPLTFVVTRLMRTKQRASQASFSDVTEFTQELFHGIHVIRAFNKEFRSFISFKGLNKENLDRNMNVAFLDSIVAPLTYTAPLICLVLNLIINGTKVTEHAMSVGEFVALNGYLILVIGPLMGIGALASVTQKGLASLDRIKAFLQLPEECEGGDEELLSLEAIRVNHLTFTYPDTTHEALNDVSMVIPKGFFVGIVGTPGSGKSTLFKMLLRTQEVPMGTLYIGDRDVHDISLASLRRSMAYVPQTAYVLSGTVEENIAFGMAGEAPLEVGEAARRAYLEVDLGERLKSDSKLKEGGRDLSGGQRQRLSIARALWKNAPYLLLDDAFSALDFHSAKEVLRELRQEKEQTIIFISQRLEALTETDKIYVFDEGKVVEEGTHEELLRLQGVYANLYAQQVEGRGTDGTIG